MTSLDIRWYATDLGGTSSSSSIVESMPSLMLALTLTATTAFEVPKDGIKAGAVVLSPMLFPTVRKGFAAISEKYKGVPMNKPFATPADFVDLVGDRTMRLSETPLCHI